jgi:hypothetical protein
MTTKTLIRSLLIGMAAVAVLAAAKPTKKSAVVTLATPTLVAGAVAYGTVVFEHDDDRMARGEPCTTVYEANPTTKERGRVIVEFMCSPRERPVASKFEAICARASIGGPDLLVEYQFAGDREGHGVPLTKGLMAH